MKKTIVFAMIFLLFCSAVSRVSATDVIFSRGSFCKKIADTVQSSDPIIDASAIVNPFSDLGGDEDYYEAVLWMTAMEYIKGYEDGTFKPEGSLTCGEVAHWLVNMLFGEITVPDDVELGNEWYAEYAWKAKESGIMPNIVKWDDYAYESDIDYDALKQYATNDNISIIIDGKKQKTDVPPFMKNGYLMAPLRFTFESLETTVEWDDSTQTVTSRKNGTTIVMQINSNIMYINGVQTTLDVAPCIVDSRTLVPISVIAEVFDSQVYWYPEINTMIIKNSKNITEEPKEEFDAKANIINGNVIITADISSISKDKNIHTALYDGDGKMVDYIIVPNIYSNNTVNIVFKYSMEMEYAKVFVWKSLGTAQPIAESVLLILNNPL